MSDDLDAMFADIDKLFDMAPFFKCPNCGAREDPDGRASSKNGPTFYTLLIEASMDVEVDNIRKEFVADPKTWNFNQEAPNEVQLLCDHCQHIFPIPEGWTYRLQ